jgi:hypothetical protein
MKLVESRLVGDHRVVLTTSPSALMDRLGAVAHLADRRLWTWPYEVIARRSQMTKQQTAQYRQAMLPFRVRRDTPLWKGRVLHLKGVFSGEHNATYFYQEARPSRRAVASMKRTIANEQRPQRIPKMQEDLDARIRGKGDATYWLGLIAVTDPDTERRRPEVAFEYFAKRTLVKPWRGGVIYNMGRIMEAMGEPTRAAQYYRGAVDSPDSPGNLLRARWLDPAGENQPDSSIYDVPRVETPTR